MFAGEVLKLYVAGKRNFGRIEADFMGVNLPEIDLSEICLLEPSFTGANLRGANLRQASLRYAHLDYCDLGESNLEGANLSHAKFLTAVLSKANLQGADVSEAKLIDVNLKGANLSNANLSNSFLHCVDLEDSNLFNVQITGIILRGSNLFLTTRVDNEADAALRIRLNKLSLNKHLFYSDGDYNMAAFVWESDRAMITIQDILKLGNYSTNTAHKVDEIDWYNHPHTTGEEEYNDLIKIFKNELKNTKIYWLAENSKDISGTVDIYVIGRTRSGNFAGVAAPQLSWT